MGHEGWWEKAPGIISNSQEADGWALGLLLPREQWEAGCLCWRLSHVLGYAVPGAGPGRCGCGNMCPGFQMIERELRGEAGKCSPVSLHTGVSCLGGFPLPWWSLSRMLSLHSPGVSALCPPHPRLSLHLAPPSRLGDLKLPEDRATLPSQDLGSLQEADPRALLNAFSLGSGVWGETHPGSPGGGEGRAEAAGSQAGRSGNCP